MENRVILLRYGEIALKSKPVRRSLIQKLVENIRVHFLASGLECHISSDYGRIYLYCDDHEKATNVLKRVFGLVSFSSCVETTSELEALTEEVSRQAGAWLKEGIRFAIRAKRIGTHPYSSQFLAERLGSFVLESVKDLKVDLDNPDAEIFVEVRHNRAFIFNGSTKGPGGLPLGSQGLVLAFVENEEDLVASWLMMKRGCKVDVAHQHEEGHHRMLRLWDPNIAFHKCNSFDDVFNMNEELNSDGLVFGWDLEKALDMKLKRNVPIFYPLSGLGAHEIAALKDSIMALQKHSDEEARKVAQNAADADNYHGLLG